MKRCPKCGDLKSTAEFHRNRSRPDGLSDRCKDCNCAAPRTSDASWRIQRHGLTVEQYETILALQGGVCADCGKDRRLDIDHDHSCCYGRYSCGACVRGLVCRSCNELRKSADRRQPASTG